MEKEQENLTRIKTNSPGEDSTTNRFFTPTSEEEVLPEEQRKSLKLAAQRAASPPFSFGREEPLLREGEKEEIFVIMILFYFYSTEINVTKMP